MTERQHEQSKPNRKRKRDRLLEFGERLIHSRRALWGIGLASFLEALIVPIPLETILLPFLQARRQQMWLISGIVLATCLLAAVAGYFVGYFLYDLIGEQVINWVSSPEQFEEVRQKMQRNGFWFVFSVGVVPIPFQIAMLAAGATKYSLLSFLIASTLARSIRYYGLAALVYYTGNRAEKLFQRHKRSASLALVLIIGAAWAFALFG